MASFAISAGSFLTRVGFGGGKDFGRGTSCLGTGCAIILGGMMGSGFRGITGSLGKGGKAGAVVGSYVMTGGVRSSGFSGATGCGIGATMTSSVPSCLAEWERTRNQLHVSESIVRVAT